MQPGLVSADSSLLSDTGDKTMSQSPNASTDSQLIASGNSAVSSTLAPVSDLPSQFAAVNLVSQPSLGTASILSTPPQPLSSTMQPKPGSYASPLLLSGVSAPPPISTSIGLAPPTALSTGTSVPGPPPKAGFQPVPHSLQEYESHSHLAGSPQQLASVPPVSSTAAAGVNIFTPAYDASAPSPYSSPSPAIMTPSSYSPPTPLGGMHSNSNSNTSIVQLDMPTGQSPITQEQGYQLQSPQDLGSLLEWLKTNETVTKMMQKAKVGVESVITAMDPQMKDVLYSGGDINIVVASAKAVKVEPVKEAFQKRFGRATVTGVDSQPGIAPQPVGFSAGIKGCEERISNMRRNGLVNERQVIVAIESFIVDVQSEQWYDIACLILSDPVNNITLQTFSQAMPLSLEHVQQAQTETPSDYNLAWSGLAVTIGQIIHRHNPAIDPADFHYYYTGLSRSDSLLLAAKQLAFLYKQRLPSAS